MSATPRPWSPIPATEGAVTALAAGQSLTLAVVDDGADSRLLRTERGAAWTADSHGMPAETLVASLWVHGTRALAGTYGDGLFVSTDGGLHWLPTVGLPPVSSVLTFAAHGRLLWAGTRAHGVYHSADGGESWAEANAGLPWMGRGLEVGALAAMPGAVVASHPLGLHGLTDGASAWEPLSSGLHADPARGLTATPTGVLVAAQGGALVRSPDGGRTWAASLPPLAAIPLAAIGPALYAAVADGIVRSDDGGMGWSSFRAGLPPGASVVHMAGARGVLWAGTLGHGLWRRVAPARLPQADQVPRPVLDGGSPNPFHDETTVAFRLPRAAHVVLAVDDEGGAEVARLDEGTRAAGPHHVPFRADALPVGFYTARLDVEGQRWTRVMLRH